MNWHQACELPYYHGSDLGANPTAEETTFKLWAPTACGGVVCLYATGTDTERELLARELQREMAASILRRIAAATREIRQAATAAGRQ